MFDEKGKPVPIDKNVPLFKNWTDLANFKDGQRWRVLYGDGPEKSVVEKLFDVVVGTLMSLASLAHPFCSRIRNIKKQNDARAHCHLVMGSNKRRRKSYILPVWQL
jgi:hypothetical protein